MSRADERVDPCRVVYLNQHAIQSPLLYLSSGRQDIWRCHLSSFVHVCNRSVPTFAS